MRYAIISDVHANLEALDTVLKDIDKKNVDKVISCGDVVGYGPNPVECIKVLRNNGIPSVAGNHDLCVAGLLSFVGWRGEARDTWVMAQKLLKDEDREWLINNPRRLYLEDEIMVVHGSPRFPSEEYLTTLTVGLNNLSLIPGKICFIGHSHVPVVFEYTSTVGKVYNPKSKRFFWSPPQRVMIKPENRYFINPGSVGQPRDSNPRSSYCIYDTKAGHVTHYRVSYHYEITQWQMIEKFYPEFLIERLPHGI